MKIEHFDVVIVGAGAAGLMCAIQAAHRGRSVALLEHNNAVGKKIRISGGGRCNFTNLQASFDRYLSENPHFAKSALARFTPADFCDMVRRHGISYHEKKLGQLFCDDSAQNIIDMLIKECAKHHVKIFLETKVTTLSRDQSFLISTNRGRFQGSSLVIATGGLSIAPLGATAFGYNIAQQFGLKINPCRPGLVPLVLAPHDVKIFASLSGVSVDCRVSCQGASFRENILFTHKGLSGPAILQISSYWHPGRPIEIDLSPERSFLDIFKSGGKTTLQNVLKQHLPARLADVLCVYFLESKPINQLSPKQLESAAHFLHHWTLIPHTTEGYAKAEVTVGGVDTGDLSSKTMETKKVPGLYFIGEVVDVTGHLGGYNFQWAWASGYAAGLAV